MSDVLLHRRLTALPLGLLGLLACTPSLNWREVKPADAQGLVALFPCKPDESTRQLAVPGLSGGPVRMHVLSCEAGGVRWALSHLDASSPQRLAQALPALDEALWRNLSAARPASARQEALGPARIQGADSHASARQWLLTGLRPTPLNQAQGVQVMSWSFARGLTAFQASVWKDEGDGPLQVHDPAIEAFVQGFNFPR
jgi:hypothetical protein